MKKFKVLKVNLIIAIILTIPSSIMWTFDVIYNDMTYIVTNLQVMQTIILVFIIMFIVYFLGLNIFCIPIYIIKAFLRLKKNINEQYIDTKESIYNRDLPQEYNCVIAGEILDFKCSLKNEYIAGIIELISKGYIIENEDKLVINNQKTTDNLLKNEKYILETCTKIDNNSYFKYSHEFFKKVREDMFDLGLYKENKFLKKIKEKVAYVLLKEEQEKGKRLITIALISYITYILLIMALIFNFKLMFFIIAFLYITIVILIRKNKLTKKGEIEKEKISKLKLFFDKETNFKDKTKEERKMWGRYSAFAVALGNNEKIKEDMINKYLIKL